MPTRCLSQVISVAATAVVIVDGTQVESLLPTQLYVCNRGATSASLRLYHRLSNAALNTKQYLYFDASIAGLSTQIFQLQIGLTPGDTLNAYSDSADLTFILYGN